LPGTATHHLSVRALPSIGPRRAHRESPGFGRNQRRVQPSGDGLLPRTRQLSIAAFAPDEGEPLGAQLAGSKTPC
jgi:hypothetical protein